MTRYKTIALPRRNAALTLVETIVVIAIIGVLVSLMLPALQRARELSRRLHCSNNLKQLGLAAHNYHHTKGEFPASWPNGNVSITWGRSLLPFLEKEQLQLAWDPNLKFLEGANGNLAGKPVATYKCPSAPSVSIYEYERTGYPRYYGTTDYKGCQGANASDPAVAHWGLVGWQQGVVSRKAVPIKDIADGLSNTFLLVESVGGLFLYNPQGDSWTVPTIWTPTDGSWAGRALSSVSPVLYAKRWGLPRCTVNCSNMYDYGPYAFHPGGAQAALCDGTVMFLNEEIDGAVLAAFYAYKEGQLIGAE